jgi:ZIP family zinc transporter
MAVGVSFASVLAGNVGVSLLSAIILAVGIGIQNIPEGSIVSMPMYLKINSKKKSFLYGVLSGIVEPIASLITICLLNFVVPVLPFLLSFAAGAMIYVVVEELIPEMHKDSNSKIGVLCVIVGFMVMMILDIALG